MKTISSIFIFLFLLFSCKSDVLNETIDNSHLVQEKNLFLEKITEGIDSTNNISLKLLSYEKINDIDSQEEKNSLISEIVDKDNFYFFNYDTSDKTFSDLKVYKFDELSNLNLVSKHEFYKQFEGALKSNSDALEKIVNIGYSIYTLNWEVQNEKINTLAIFNGGEFVYDNLLSNLITFESKKITAQDNATYKRSNLLKNKTI